MLQTQGLSPLQVMVARLLGLTTIEMEERVRGEVIDNPALEASVREDVSDTADDNSDDDSYMDTSESIIAGDYSNEDDIPDYKLSALPQSPEQQVFQ